MKIKRKTLEQFKKWLLIILGVSLVVFLWYGYFRTNFFLITTYSIVGATDEEVGEMLPKLMEESKNHTWRLFPHNKLLTYSEDSLKEIISLSIPEASSISIRSRGLHTLKIAIIKHEPMFRTETGKAVTGEGIIFSTRADLSQYPILSAASSTITSIEMNGLLFSKFSVDEAILAKIKDFESKISDVIFPVAAVTIDANRDISFIDNRGVSKVIITEDTDVKKAWSTLVSAIDTEPLKSKLKENILLLEYLDVRFGNKVFYKFSDKPLETVASPVIIENHDQATTTVSE